MPEIICLGQYFDTDVLYSIVCENIDTWKQYVDTDVYEIDYILNIKSSGEKAKILNIAIKIPKYEIRANEDRTFIGLRQRLELFDNNDEEECVFVDIFSSSGWKEMIQNDLERLHLL